VGVLDRFAQLARGTLVSLTDRTFGRTQKPLPELTDSELEEELIRRRRARAARRTGGATAEEATATEARARSPKDDAQARSPQEQQLTQYYANLELAPGATLDEVRRAYRDLMKRYHPDKHLGDPERHKAATELAQSLTRAYTALVELLSKK
jgi:DnaJ-domain-containing protein 1